jgi:hypothetical protein
MTGVEAVSNGVMAFREPTNKCARATLTIIIGILILMLAGIAFLVRAYGIAATEPGVQGYQSILSQLLGAIAGRGMFYWISIGSILVVLALSANTAFADFPRLSRAIAQNGFLPYLLTLRGRRLVFGQGVYALALLTGVLLVLFGGVTDRLIPLYAVGAFMAFTLSQAGMVMHWRRVGGPGARNSMFLNGLGATATALTVAVVLIAKFTEGAWITLLLVPGLMLLMRSVKRHYDHLAEETKDDTPANTKDLCAPLVVLPIERWSVVSKKALRFAWTISTEIRMVHIECGEETESLCRSWSELVEQPAKHAGLPVPELVLLKSPYRFVVRPIVDYILNVQSENPDRHVAVLVPELVESRWYYYLLHSNRSEILKALLLFKGNQRITITNIPWYLND